MRLCPRSSPGATADHAAAVALGAMGYHDVQQPPATGGVSHSTHCHGIGQEIVSQGQSVGGRSCDDERHTDLFDDVGDNGSLAASPTARGIVRCDHIIGVIDALGFTATHCRALLKIAAAKVATFSKSEEQDTLVQRLEVR